MTRRLRAMAYPPPPTAITPPYRLLRLCAYPYYPYYYGPSVSFGFGFGGGHGWGGFHGGGFHGGGWRHR